MLWFVQDGYAFCASLTPRLFSINPEIAEHKIFLHEVSYYMYMNSTSICTPQSYTCICVCVCVCVCVWPLCFSTYMYLPMFLLKWCFPDIVIVVVVVVVSCWRCVRAMRMCWSSCRVTSLSLHWCHWRSVQQVTSVTSPGWHAPLPLLPPFPSSGALASSYYLAESRNQIFGAIYKAVNSGTPTLEEAGKAAMRKVHNKEWMLYIKVSLPNSSLP